MKRKQQANGKDFINSRNKKKISISDICLSGKENIDFKDELGFSKLHWAAFEGNLKLVKDCMKNKANVNLFTDEGDSALCLSLFGKHYVVAKYLIKCGAKVNVFDKYGNTPLHLACEQGDLNMAVYLIRNGAFKNVTNKDGDNVLHYACESADSNLKIIEFLLKTSPGLNKLNLKNETPADICLYMNQFKGLEYLINKGAVFKIFSLDMYKYFRERCEVNKPQKVQTINYESTPPDSGVKPVDSEVIGEAS